MNIQFRMYVDCEYAYNWCTK